jgi:hypothetical protein
LTKEDPKPIVQNPPEPPKEKTTAGHLAHNSNYYRAQHTQPRRSDTETEIFVGDDTQTDTPLEELLPTTKVAINTNLPEPAFRPPVFLRPLETMAVTYMHKKGRMSPKTKKLLESPDFDDMLTMLRNLHEDETLIRKSEARLKASFMTALRAEPGPLLLGLQDPRLTEPWRLFLDEWDIWSIGDKVGGVELFWEGEAENDDDELIGLSQSLCFKDGELTLITKMGEEQDTLSFDGQAFYRLKAPAFGKL